MSDSVIESGIPIPPPQKNGLSDRYPEILCLEIGDSFLAKNAPLGLRIGIALFGIERDQRHAVRKIEGDDYRVWRIA